jgi:hypothetical protein
MRVARGNSTQKWSAQGSFNLEASGLSDVTDRSHHWIGPFLRQIIPGLKCFSRFRVECRFLGRKRPSLALVGVGHGIFSVLGPGGQNRRDSREEIPRRVLEWSMGPRPPGPRPSPRRLRIGPTKRNPTPPPHSRLRRVFRRNGAEKVHVWYRNSPVTGWIYCSWNERQNVGAWTKPLSPYRPFEGNVNPTRNSA